MALVTWALTNQFDQETFDIPINIPAYNTDQFNGVSLGQLGSSQNLVVGGGATNDLVSYDQDTDSFLTTWADDPGLFHTGVNAYIVDICSSNQDFYGA